MRLSRIGRTSVTYECAAYRVEDDMLTVAAKQTLVLVDLTARTPCEIPQSFRDPIVRFEGADVDA